MLGYPEAGLVVTFVDTSEICALHEQYFDDASPTNVVSLEYGMPPAFAQAILGEVFVCVDVAEAEAHAVEPPLSLDYRLGQLVLHGLLHVLGYEHVGVDDHCRQQMEEWEERLEQTVLEEIVQ